MNAPPREIPVIDLWTGKPWAPEPAGDPDIKPAQDTAPDPALEFAPERAGNAGPQIAPHRLVDAAAVDLADSREERRRGCRGCRKWRDIRLNPEERAADQDY